MNPELMCSQGIGHGKVCLTQDMVRYFSPESSLLFWSMVTLPTELLLHDISDGFSFSIPEYFMPCLI